MIDDRHIVTCAHVINASIGRPLNAAERPDRVGLVEVRCDGQWIEVAVTLAEWKPLIEDKRGDVAVLEMTAGRPGGVSAVPLRRPHPTVDHRILQLSALPRNPLKTVAGLSFPPFGKLSVIRSPFEPPTPPPGLTGCPARPAA